MLRHTNIFLFLIISAILLSWSVVETEQVSKWISDPAADTLKNPFRADTLAYKEGKKIYDGTCWTCHGKSGRGDGPAAKSLIVKPADHTDPIVQKQSDGALFWKINKGRGQMAPYEKTYSKAQRWKLVNYIRRLGKTGGTK